MNGVFATHDLYKIIYFSELNSEYEMKDVVLPS